VWWAAHHRHHHAYSDKPEDLHSPKQHGFWQAHFGWFLSPSAQDPDLKHVRDLSKYPELRWIERVDLWIPAALALLLFGAGALVSHADFHARAACWQFLVWGFFISTVACWHATYTINSLSHVIGWRRYKTADTSRNNPMLALLTLGEGWHNNHHHYPSATRQGHRWWEFDPTFYGLKFLSWCGIIWHLREVPQRLRRPLIPASGSDASQDK
jgi:stearoyl-CoA desaturase (delta-9 desaturase)